MSAGNVYRFVPRRQPEPPRPHWRQPRLSAGAALAIVFGASLALWAAAIAALLAWL